jgi:hypothetical protein
MWWGEELNPLDSVRRDANPRRDRNSIADGKQTPVPKLIPYCQAHNTTRRDKGKTRGSSHLVMAGLVPAIPVIEHCAILIEIAGKSPAMTP